MSIAESETYKGHEIEIKYDESPESPRNWDNICIFHVAHRNCSFGDVNHSNSESIHSAVEKARKQGDIVLPLYMYEHGGITISLSPFSCPWDSGQCSFVVIPRKKMLEEFGKKAFTKKLKERAIKCAKGEVETLDTYLRGDVYGYVIDDDDSCWGFYSSIEDVMCEARSEVDGIIKYNIKKHCEQLKKWIKNKVPLSVRISLEV